jgi:hypothetical protein
MTLQSLTISLSLFILMTSLLSTNGVSADDRAAKVMDNSVIIDDRSNAGMLSSMGTEWRLISDNVMGGLSEGKLTLHNHEGKECLRMQGYVTTENNGGFVQMALPLSDDVFDAGEYQGIEIEVSGNGELYNFHLRTNELWFPWQSYRYSFTASPHWQSYRIPFAKLEKYKTFTRFDKKQLTRLGLVAIGRDFEADLCLASVKFYAE